MVRLHRDGSLVWEVQNGRMLVDDLWNKLISVEALGIAERTCLPRNLDQVYLDARRN